LNELERIVGFTRYLDERCSDRIFASVPATGLMCSSLPLVHDRNFLRVEDAGVNASELATLAGQVFMDAGLDCLRVYTDSFEIGKRLQPQFEQLGWKTDKLLVMVYSDTDRGQLLPVVAEVEQAEMVPFWEAENNVDHPNSAKLVRQLTEQNILVAERIDARYFGRRLDGKVVSACQLYSRGATAQIESVGTLPDYRRRGLASSVIRHAIAEAQIAGHDLIWLIADEDDWPKALYAKLGFMPIGRFRAFLRRGRA